MKAIKYGNIFIVYVIFVTLSAIVVSLSLTVSLHTRSQAREAGSEKTGHSLPFFADVPVFPDSLPVSFREEPLSGHVLSHGQWSSAAPVPDLSAWYADAMVGAGWTVHAPPADPQARDIQYLVFAMDTTRYVNLSLVRNADRGLTVISMDGFTDAARQEEGEEEE
jgi:hypothetical protein